MEFQCVLHFLVLDTAGKPKSGRLCAFPSLALLLLSVVSCSTVKIKHCRATLIHWKRYSAITNEVSVAPVLCLRQYCGCRKWQSTWQPVWLSEVFSVAFPYGKWPPILYAPTVLCLYCYNINEVQLYYTTSTLCLYLYFDNMKPYGTHKPITMWWLLIMQESPVHKRFILW